MNLTENLSIKKRANNSLKVYSQEPYAQELYEMYSDYFEGKTLIGKDMTIGQIVPAKVTKVSERFIEAETESGQTVFLDYPKEAKFFEKVGLGHPRPGQPIDVSIESVDSGNYHASTESAFLSNVKTQLHKSIKDGANAYKVIIKSVNDGGFIVDLSGLACFMPGSLAAANKITNFESMIGKEVYAMVETYLDSSDMFVVSVKKYIQRILPTKIREIDFMAEYEGTITGVTDYGIFIEWDEIFTGLLHHTEVESTDWKSEFKSGQVVKFWVKEIRENNRIILSKKGPNPEIITYKEFKDKYEGEIFPNATVKDIKPFGIFVEMGAVTGMISPKEFKKSGQRPKDGEILDVFVKQVDPFTKKIYLRFPDEED